MEIKKNLILAVRAMTASTGIFPFGSAVTLIIIFYVCVIWQLPYGECNLQNIIHEFIEKKNQ